MTALPCPQSQQAADAMRLSVSDINKDVWYVATTGKTKNGTMQVYQLDVQTGKSCGFFFNFEKKYSIHR